MNRDLRAIVNKIENNFSIMITVPLTNPKLYFTNNPYDFKDNLTYICDIIGNEIVVKNPSPNARPYFIIKSEDGDNIVSATRTIDVCSVENFRDQGGYINKSGKTVAWGRFFRGGAFSNVTDNQKIYLDNLGIKNIFDYRGKNEAVHSPDYVPINSNQNHIPAIKENEDNVNMTAVYTLEDHIKSFTSLNDMDHAFEEFRNIYKALPFENPAYQAMINSLDNVETAHIYQHCSAGKDRTGVGCAILLTSLGVDEHTVIGDYCLSATFRENINEEYIQKISDSIQNEKVISFIRRMLSVEESLIKTSFNEIYAKYPDFDTYLNAEYDVTKDRLNHWRNIHCI